MRLQQAFPKLFLPPEAEFSGSFQPYSYSSRPTPYRKGTYRSLKQNVMNAVTHEARFISDFSCV